MDGGDNWEIMNPSMPRVAVHDLKIQPEAMDLLVGTHGRSIYKADLESLELLSDCNISICLASLPAITHTDAWGRKYSNWREPFESSLSFTAFAKANATATIEIRTLDSKELKRSRRDKVLKTWEVEMDQGLNFIDYDLSVAPEAVEYFENDNRPKEADNSKFYLPAGEYVVKVTSTLGTASQKLTVSSNQ
jgi:hypothetical protein